MPRQWKGPLVLWFCLTCNWRCFNGPLLLGKIKQNLAFFFMQVLLLSRSLLKGTIQYIQSCITWAASLLGTIKQNLAFFFMRVLLLGRALLKGTIQYHILPESSGWFADMSFCKPWVIRDCTLSTCSIYRKPGRSENEEKIHKTQCMVQCIKWEHLGSVKTTYQGLLMAWRHQLLVCHQDKLL